MLKNGYMFITPEPDGSPIAGPSVYTMAPDSIEVVDIEHKVHRDVDLQHGVTTGDTHHSPLTIYKAVDCTSPKLYNMCCDGTNLTEVKIQYYIQIGNQAEPVDFYSWKLENAYICEVRQIPARELGGEFADQYDLLEAISFIYQGIEWETYAHRSPIGLKDLPADVQRDEWSTTA